MRQFNDFFQQCEHSGAKYWFERSIYSTERDSSAFDMQRNRTYDCLLFLGMYSTYHFGVIEYNNDWSTLKIRWRARETLIEMLEACMSDISSILLTNKPFSI